MSQLTQQQKLAVNRRAFVASAMASGWLPFGTKVFGVEKKNVPVTGYPFQLSVASGEPTSDGIVLWTRLAPKPLAPAGGMPNENVQVSWMVAKDEGMTKVVKKGTTTANPDFAHSVHVEVNGLEPNRWYYYQFKALGDTSPIGRTKTAPSPGDSLSEFKFAFASCQHYEMGFFNGYTHMAQEPLDLVVHLGDYFYEYGPSSSSNNPRKHLGAEIKTLEDYRRRHAQYKTDPDLQLVHSMFPWLVTWDDHEFDNNYANLVSEEKDIKPEDFIARRAAAYRAYFEHMPLRKASLPKGHQMQLYRKVPFGNLINFYVLDTRQYRTDQPCGDKNGPPCEQTYDKDATILGKQQKDWLFTGMKKSEAQWNILAQQVMMARVDRRPGEEIHWSRDQWPGYDLETKEVLKYISDCKVSNPVVLTGDIHCNWANDLKVDFDKPESPTVATELVGTSITSGRNGYDESDNSKKMLSENPFVKFFNANRGYVSCSLNKKQWETKYQTTPRVDIPESELVTRATFVIENGKPGVQKA